MGRPCRWRTCRVRGRCWRCPRPRCPPSHVFPYRSALRRQGARSTQQQHRSPGAQQAGHRVRVGILDDVRPHVAFLVPKTQHDPFECLSVDDSGAVRLEPDPHASIGVHLEQLNLDTPWFWVRCLEEKSDIVGDRGVERDRRHERQATEHGPQPSGKPVDDLIGGLRVLPPQRFVVARPADLLQRERSGSAIFMSVFSSSRSPRSAFEMVRSLTPARSANALWVPIPSASRALRIAAPSAVRRRPGMTGSPQDDAS